MENYVFGEVDKEGNHAGGKKECREGRGRGLGVGQLAAQVVAKTQTSHDDSDHDGPDVGRGTKVRGKQAGSHQLKDHDTGAGDEGD